MAVMGQASREWGAIVEGVMRAALGQFHLESRVRPWSSEGHVFCVQDIPGGGKH
jgi:hypothetical protein